MWKSCCCLSISGHVNHIFTTLLVHHISQDPFTHQTKFAIITVMVTHTLVDLLCWSLSDILKQYDIKLKGHKHHNCHIFEGFLWTVVLYMHTLCEMYWQACLVWVAGLVSTYQAFSSQTNSDTFLVLFDIPFVFLSLTAWKEHVLQYSQWWWPLSVKKKKNMHNGDQIIWKWKVWWTLWGGCGSGGIVEGCGSIPGSDCMSKCS